jgi:hypothetical protein
MSLEKLSLWLSRIFFVGAFALLGLALLERVVNAAGYTLSPLYQSGRLLDFAVVLLVFEIAIQVRTIKEELKAKKS